MDLNGLRFVRPNRNRRSPRSSTLEAVQHTINLVEPMESGETQDELQIYRAPIKELSLSLKCLRSILHEYFSQNQTVLRATSSTAGSCSDTNSLLHDINQFFAKSPNDIPDDANAHDQLLHYHRRISGKVLVFQNAWLSGELTMIHNVLLDVGILSPQMPVVSSEQHMSERTVPDGLNEVCSLDFLNHPVHLGLFVGYYIYVHEPILVGHMASRLILRFDFKIKVVQQINNSDLVAHFDGEMGQFDNRLQTVSFREISFIKRYQPGNLPSQSLGELEGRRLQVQKWEFGGEWRDQNLEMHDAECLGNFIHYEIDTEVALDGVWYGFYFYGTREQRQPRDQPMHLTLRSGDDGVTVTGEGTDQLGEFLIIGSVRKDEHPRRRLEWRKIYTAQYTHGWDYRGWIEAGGRGVTGTWGSGLRNFGTFSIARVE